MKRHNMAMDQTIAWLLASIATLALGGGLYALLRANIQNPQSISESKPNSDDSEPNSSASTPEHQPSQTEKPQADLAAASTLEKINKKNTLAAWGYSGQLGPEHWGDLSPAYADCQLGTEQSPIDITKPSRSHDLRPLKFNYKSAALTLENKDHTLTATYPPGSYLLADGMRYDLVRFLFHLPSEHTVDGLPYDMELQLIHQHADGRLAILAVFMEEGRKAHPGLEKIWHKLPKNVNESEGVVQFNVKELLPMTQSYYAYNGSLTTPPCREGVKWLVLNQTIKISPQQIDRFMALYRHNVRPVQALNKRSIYESTAR